MAAVRRVPWEIWALLALIVLDGAAVIATYSRFPATELYRVRHTGTLAAGFGRELVALNFRSHSSGSRSSASPGRACTARCGSPAWWRSGSVPSSTSR